MSDILWPLLIVIIVVGIGISIVVNPLLFVFGMIVIVLFVVGGYVFEPGDHELYHRGKGKK